MSSLDVGHHFSSVKDLESAAKGSLQRITYTKEPLNNYLHAYKNYIYDRVGRLLVSLPHGLIF